LAALRKPQIGSPSHDTTITNLIFYQHFYGTTTELVNKNMCTLIHIIHFGTCLIYSADTFYMTLSYGCVRSARALSTSDHTWRRITGLVSVLGQYGNSGGQDNVLGLHYPALVHYYTDLTH